MPETLTAEPDKRLAAPAGEGGEPKAPGSDAQDKQAFFKSFKTEAEATKAWDEVHGTLTRAQQENAALQEQLDAALERAKEQELEALKARQDALERQVSVSADKFDPQAEEARILAEIEGDSPGKAILDLTRQGYAEAKRFAEQQLKAVQDQIKAQAETIQALRDEADPVYQSQREQVDKMAKKLQLPRGKVIEMFKMMPKEEQVPGPESEVPASVGGGNKVHAQKETGPTKFVSDEERAVMRSHGLTDADIDAIEARHKLEQGAQ